MQAIQFFMLFEAAAFIAAALIHFGRMVDGYEHLKAGIAESVIGVVLLVGLALTWIRPVSMTIVKIPTPMSANV